MDIFCPLLTSWGVGSSFLVYKGADSRSPSCWVAIGGRVLEPGTLPNPGNTKDSPVVGPRHLTCKELSLEAGRDSDPVCR